jgi:catechol 2,3-dioxygenase-like lactoylglutathione lyase family enzyme
VDLQFRSSVILVRDVQTSRRFYEGLLGQVVAMDHGENAAYDGGFSIWDREYAWGVIHGQPPEEVSGSHGECGHRGFGHGGFGHEACELYFKAGDLDAVAGRLAEAGALFVHPIREQPWGQRVLRVRDPDGFIVEIGESMSATIQRYLRGGLTPEQTAARTSMPLDFANRIARQVT